MNTVNIPTTTLKDFLRISFSVTHFLKARMTTDSLSLMSNIICARIVITTTAALIAIFNPVPMIVVMPFITAKNASKVF